MKPAWNTSREPAILQTNHPGILKRKQPGRQPELETQAHSRAGWSTWTDVAGLFHDLETESPFHGCTGAGKQLVIDSPGWGSN